jgi:hypothetical protein
MNYLETYLKKAEEAVPGSPVSLQLSAESFTDKYLMTFSFNEHLSGLLFGHVQSGKTGQMFGVASAAADNGFKFFVLMTTDNVMLYRQTLERTKRSLGGFMDGFRVLGETDDDEFLKIPKTPIPTMVVLKKNVRVLKHWLNHIGTNPYFKEQPLFLLDDEGDASSLNTKINQSDKSAIHHGLDSLRKQAPSSFYLHVTATPQSLLLQSKESDWRPAFAHYIAPGAKYLGGDFFYGENSQCIRPTPDNEKNSLLKTKEIPEGFRKAVLSFLIAGAHSLISKERPVCSMLIHPGIKISEHDKAKEKVEQYLEEVRHDILNEAQTFPHGLQDAWNDLQKTKPGLSSIEEVIAFLKNGLPQINVLTLNKNTLDGVRYDTGLNVLVGGNSLSRGVTFSGLHTVYYCRSSKTPQADTCWQHARIFGYDRDGGLCRIFTPEPLAKLFRELNDANNALFSILREKGPEAVSVLTPDGTRPTRPNVLKGDELAILAGGVNYFPSLPLSINLKKLDELLGSEDTDKFASVEDILRILELVRTDKSDPWESHNFPSCIHALNKSSQKPECRIVVRVDRSIGKNTGTLLSPDDRELGKKYNDKLVLTVYRVRGEIEKGWDGTPLWIPNIKFADGACFYLNSR